MEIEVKGHSGCQIDVVKEDRDIFVYKSTRDPKYLNRLVAQADKQMAASKIEYQHIRVPKIFDVVKADNQTSVKMQYVYSKNFIEFFEQAGFEQIDYLIGALEYFVETEIKDSPLQTVPAQIFRDKFADIKSKVSANPIYEEDGEIAGILERSRLVFEGMLDLALPVGKCHGDLTFSNILFNGNNYYLIDFLDSFVETPLQDIVKIRQDTAYRWSQLMYSKKFDSVRLRIICDKIDCEIDEYFSKKYRWYRECYSVMQLMNILRILPYAHEKKVVEYLKQVLQSILDSFGTKPASFCDKEVEKKKSGASTRNLIVPVAADKAEYKNGLPYVFGQDRDGIIICIKSILGLDWHRFDNVYFTILKKHDERFFISDSLNLQFRRLGLANAKVVVLDTPTKDQAETIYNTIKKEKIEGLIFVKDADSFFDVELDDGNGIAIFPIEDMEMLSPKDKSYVAVDEMYYITNVIEKSVVSHFINAGGYSFENAADFCSHYESLRGFGKLYLSHIIYDMLLEKKSFRPMIASDYKDWGTNADWQRNN